MERLALVACVLLAGCATVRSIAYRTPAGEAVVALAAPSRNVAWAVGERRSDRWYARGAEGGFAVRCVRGACERWTFAEPLAAVWAHADAVWVGGVGVLAERVGDRWLRAPIGDGATWRAIAGTGRSGVWALGVARSGEAVLAHSDGARWSTWPAPVAVASGSAALIPDGRGGLIVVGPQVYAFDGDIWRKITDEGADAAVPSLAGNLIVARHELRELHPDGTSRLLTTLPSTGTRVMLARAGRSLWIATSRPPADPTTQRSAYGMPNRPFLARWRDDTLEEFDLANATDELVALSLAERRITAIAGSPDGDVWVVVNGRVVYHHDG
jgi:hypothetical protein